MKESNWEDCLQGSARKISKDENRARSLIQTAEERINLIKRTDKKNCNFVFEDYYTSLLEFLQASAFLNGFNIQNHICIGFYIRDFLKRQDLFILFDDVRYKRNSLIYYGDKMDFETAKQAIEKTKKLIKEIKEMLK